MADNNNQQDVINKTGKSAANGVGLDLQRKLLGLPEKPANSAPVGNGVGDVWSKELAYAPTPRGTPNFDHAKTSDDEAKAAWEKLLTDPDSGDFYSALRENVIRSTKERLKAVGGKLATSGDATPKLRMNLRALRMREGEDGANDYLTEEMRKFDFAFKAVGENPSERPAPYSNEYLATLEISRFAGRTPVTDTDERDVLQTIVCENLRHVFPLDQPWTDSKPWDADRQKIAAQELQLTGDKSKYAPELDKLHKRFLVATVFAMTNESGRPYGVQSNRETMNQFILDHMGVDLKVKAPTAPPGFIPKPPDIISWTAKDRKDVAKKYGVTELEAEQMRERVTNIVNGKVF